MKSRTWTPLNHRIAMADAGLKYARYSEMLRPRGQTGFEAKILASARGVPKDLG